MDDALHRHIDRIVSDPRILDGKPIIKGTRIAVDLVLEELSQNPDVGEVLAAHPDLSGADVQACLAYAHAVLIGGQAPTRAPDGPRRLG